MREVRGYVCIASAPLGGNRRFELLFGRYAGADGKSYQSLLTSDFLTFRSRREAEKASREIILLEREFNQAQIAYLNMKIADKEGEAEKYFRKNKSLIVVVALDLGFKFYGENIGGNLMSTFSGAYDLFLNGFKPFGSYERALDVARDAHRQSECPANIASFKLRRV
jgi:hypothetical protein